MDKKPFEQCRFLLDTISLYTIWLALASRSSKVHIDKNFMVIWACMIHPQPPFLVIKQVTRSRGAFLPLAICNPDLTVFITVSRAQAKGELGERTVHLARPLFGSWRSGEGQDEAVGVSKPVCLRDLSVTLCSLSLKSLPSVHLTSLLLLLIPSFSSFSPYLFFSMCTPSFTSLWLLPFLQFQCKS